ncbi:sensor domain-containing protein [Rhodococcus sp. HNM0569]|uniref:sensor domain-containing protein n=1 Tax=Rhodococcus sp. HNM0569 TaxID=2716340 RepID=UPI00146E0DDA|nr:sensor domain-containing protein [Rhodococcus sp. HNM0569]NLU82934.1 sensor domain-containing protein [Rhodococcus sp. HNM0569]
MTARRSLAVALAAASALALAACGSDDPEPSSAPAAPAPTGVTVRPGSEAAPFSDADALAGALLTTGELPAGFVEQPDPVEDLGLEPIPESDEPDQSHTEPQECADVLAPIGDQTEGAQATAVAHFTGPDFASIDQDAASYPDAAQTVDAFTRLQAPLASCGNYRGTDADGFEVTYQVGAGPTIDLGDGTVSLRVTATSEGVTLYSDALLIAVGPTLTQVVVSGQDAADEATLRTLGQAAVDKLTA